MTVMLLAMLVSDAALNASEYRVDAAQPKSEAPAAPSRRAWTPGVKWDQPKGDCPAFFQREVAGLGQIRVSGRCGEIKQAADDLHH